LLTITIAELRVGVLLGDGDRRRERESFLRDVLEAVPVIDYDQHVAITHAELLAEVRAQGRQRGAHDLIIAATAKHARRAVVSADVRAFEDLEGVDVASPR
jgi:predicted nucleic acid-binding protein